MSSLDEIYNKLIQIQDELATAVASAKLNPKQIVIVNGLSDINNSLGSVRAGEFLALSSGQDPQDDDGTGTFISATGRVFGVDKYHIGGVKDGDLKWGANSETGELEAGDGAVRLTNTGIEIEEGSAGGKVGQYQPNSVTFVDASDSPVAEMSENLSGGSGYRTLKLGVKVPSDVTDKGLIALQVEESDGTELVWLKLDGDTQYVTVYKGLDLDETKALIGGTQIINDDAAYSFTPTETNGALLLYCTADSTVCGIIIYKADASPATYIIGAGSNTNVTTGALAGTTGTDGKFTISTHTDGKIYFENRRAAARKILWNNFSGN